MDKSDFIKWASKLASTYVLGDQSRQKLSNVDLVAIIGPTGVGKTTILDELGITEIKSDVTRSMRPHEKNHDNYNFRSDYFDMLQEIKDGKYVQFLVSGTDEFYGTCIDEYPDGGMCAMAVYANAIDDFRQLGFRRVLPIFIMPPGYIEWMKRIGSIRTGDLSARIEEAKTSIEIAVRDKEYHFVLNDDLKLAVNDIKKIIAGEQRDEHRVTLARATADVLLEKIGDKDDDMYFTD